MTKKTKATTKDLTAKDASTVKGGTENVTFNYAKVAVEYQPQK